MKLDSPNGFGLPVVIRLGFILAVREGDIFNLGREFFTVDFDLTKGVDFDYPWATVCCHRLLWFSGSQSHARVRLREISYLANQKADFCQYLLSPLADICD